MNIAFYAPMKPPDAAVPSGDRQMARTILTALRLAGHHVELAARLRSHDGAGDAARQIRLKGLGAALAARYASQALCRPTGAQPQLWFTYHLYHKAPDWIGPRVADAVGIPYVVAEASFAPKRQANGPWRIGHAAVESALRRADAVIALNSADVAGVAPLVRGPGGLTLLPPFTDVTPFQAAAQMRSSGAAEPRLIAVGMMRNGDKLESYRVLGAALALMRDVPWRLTVVGDGPARAAVRDALRPVADRVRYLGEQRPEALPALYGAADLCVWPAVREAYGLSLLEAQAAGLPVLAGAAGGVPDIVQDGATGALVPVGDAPAFADALRALLADPARRAAMGQAALVRTAAHHSLAAASRIIDDVLAKAARRRAA
jgi:glycosyltransferase involved in cell wall biosynthesis